MARLYIQQKQEEPPAWNEKDSYVLIHHCLISESSSQEFLKEFTEPNVDIVEQDWTLGGPGDVGIGQIILSLVTVAVCLVSKSFFEEIGTELGRKISKLISKKDRPGVVFLKHKHNHINIRVFTPTNLSVEDAERLLALINDFSRQTNKGGDFFFDKDGNQLIEI